VSLLFFAELTKLWGRPSARVVLITSILLGAGGPLLLLLGQGSHLTVNGADISDKIDTSVPNAIGWSLWLRGFYVAQLALLLLASQSYAGELVNQTLRDDLVRPVQRSLVLAAKGAVLAAGSLVSHVGALLVATLTGFLLLQGNGDSPWSVALAATASAWACEVGFVVFALAVSVVTRSVAGGLAGAFLFVLLERLVSVGLTVLGWAAEAMPPQFATLPAIVDTIVELGPLLPSAGWTAWESVARGDAVVWQHWVSLAGWTALSALVADRVFARTDVP
jgi:ABC-type transport system involved in multi-copper enzyme maturation permease subunit